MSAEQSVRVEDVGYKNVRFLGYNFLQDVIYNGEPVVPKIISQGKEVFRVEEIKGEDLRDLPTWKNTSAIHKFTVLYHATSQLIEIDKAGIVLFDREGRNIMANLQNDKVSVRQVDLEEFYDKNAGSVYADSPYRYDAYSFTANLFSEEGFNLWAESVQFLANQAKKILANSKIKGMDIFNKYNGISPEDESSRKILQKDLLSMLKEDLVKAIDSL